MAEEKKTPAKVEESKLTKVLNWFKKLPGRIAKPFKNMVAELKKVTWPSKKRWISSSVMVLVFMLFMGVVIGLLDLGATALVDVMIPAATENNENNVNNENESNETESNETESNENESNETESNETESNETESNETEASESTETDAEVTEAETETPAAE